MLRACFSGLAPNVILRNEATKNLWVELVLFTYPHTTPRPFASLRVTRRRTFEAKLILAARGTVILTVAGNLPFGESEIE